MSYSVVIVDDEPPARAKLARFIAELDDFRVTAEAGSVDDAIEAVRNGLPDVLYLDIQLGSHSGFDVVDGLKGAYKDGARGTGPQRCGRTRPPVIGADSRASRRINPNPGARIGPGFLSVCR